jgi:hypothetical protein
MEYGISKNYMHSVCYLYQKNVKTFDNQSKLVTLACDTGNLELIKMLFKQRFEPVRSGLVNKYYEKAINENNPDLVKFYFDYVSNGTKLGGIFLAAVKGNREILDWYNHNMNRTEPDFKFIKVMRNLKTIKNKRDDNREELIEIANWLCSKRYLAILNTLLAFQVYPSHIGANYLKLNKCIKTLCKLEQHGIYPTI